MDSNQTSNPQPYSFPILKNNEIETCLSEIGISVTEAELMEPTRHKDRIKTVFHSLVSIGLNLPDDYFTQIPPTAITKSNTLPYPDLHSESLHDLKFLLTFTKFMKICGITHLNDFNMLDIISPTPKRLKKHLSAAINFLKYSEDRATLYEKRMNERDELVNGLVEVNNERVELMARLHEIQSNADEKWDEVKVCEEDCAEIQMEIGSLNKLQGALRQETMELKKKSNALMDEAATLVLTIQELEAKENQLLPKVISSPGLIQADLTQRRKELEKETCNMNESENKLKETKMRLIHLNVAKKDVSDVIQSIQELGRVYKDYKTSKAETTAIEQQIAQNRKEVERFTVLAKEDEKEIGKLESQINSHQTQHQNTMSKLNTTYQQTHDEFLLIEQDRKHALSRIEACEAEVKLLQSVIREETTKTDLEIDEILKGYQELEQRVMEKGNILLSVIDMEMGKSR